MTIWHLSIWFYRDVLGPTTFFYNCIKSQILALMAHPTILTLQADFILYK